MKMPMIGLTLAAIAVFFSIGCNDWDARRTQDAAGCATKDNPHYAHGSHRIKASPKEYSDCMIALGWKVGTDDDNEDQHPECY